MAGGTEGLGFAEDIGCCATIQKWLIFIINIILFIFGIIQISVAGYVMAGGTEGLGFAADLFDGNDSAVNSLLAFGIIILFVSFWGCLGAKKESMFMLWMYAIILFLMIIGQSMALAVVTVSIKYGDTIFESLWKDLEADTISDIEAAYDCCSFNGDNANDTWAGDVAEYADCVSLNGWTESCWGKFESTIDENYDMVKVITAIFMGVQILIYLSAHYVMQSIAEAEGVEDAREIQIERHKGV